MRSFRDRLARPEPLLLDGATGTELNRRGVDTALPLWSAAALWEAPDVLRQIHRDYVEAGAELVTANTFRTHPRSLAAGGRRGQGPELTARAVQIAREACGDRAWVAGSQAPLEDCYSPELVPDDKALAREHELMSAQLAEAGVDVILVETQHTIREALAAATAATATGLPVLIGFVCDRDGKLLSGESLATAALAVLPLEPAGLLVNCTPTPTVGAALSGLSQVAAGLTIGAYGNIGEPDPVQGWRSTDAADPRVYSRYARSWLDHGAMLVGGCCGTTPEHIRQLASTIAKRT